MNLRIKNLKNTICYLLTTILIACSLVGLLNFFKSDNVISADAAFIGHSPKTVTNANFNNDTSTTKYPFSPKGYDSSSDEDTANVDAGIIKITDSAYSGRFTSNTNSNDDHVLMIDGGSNNSPYFGYKTEASIDLDSDSHFSISVDVFTSNNNGIGALYLYNEDDSEYSSIMNVNSSNTWTTYSFFISTNNVTSLNLKLGMYLNNKAGCILFDNISVNKLNYTTLNTWMSRYPTSTYKYIDELDNIVSTIDMTSNPFSIVSYGNDNPNYLSASYVSASDEHASDGNVNTAFKLATTSTYAQYKTSDNAFTIEKNTLYKITISVKAIDLKGNINLQLIETNLSEDQVGNDSTSLTITSSSTISTNDIRNSYKDYSFYVSGYPTKDTTYKLVFGLGDKNTSTTGTAYFTNIVMTTIDYTTFSGASTGTTAEKVDLTTDYKASTSIMFENGNFNTLKISDYNDKYPATPDAWTVPTTITSSDDHKYGIVNTADFDALTGKGFTSLRNPLDPDGSNNEGGNNILMMYNSKAGTFSYTSTTKSLDAKSYHKFSVQVQTQNSPVTISLVTTKDDNEIVLSSIKISTTMLKWETVTLYLYTGYQSLDVSIKFTLDSDSYAYAYFDNAHFDYMIQPTEQDFKTAQNGDYTIVTDLSNILTSNTSTHYSTPLFFTTNNNASQVGIVNLDGESLTSHVISNPDSLGAFISLEGDNRNVLAIRTLEDTYFTYTSLLGYKLTSGSYYKISISVFTQNLQFIDSEKDLENLGALIKLTGFDETFAAITSDEKWTTYTFYICPDNDTTTYFQLSLGSETSPCTGDVFFGNIVFDDSLTSADFDNKSDSIYTKVLRATTTGSNDNTGSDSDDDNNNDVNWMYILSSVLMVAAILIAVVGVLLKKAKFKLPRRKKTKNNTYDRTKTVSKQVHTRKANEIKKEKLQQLNSEIESLQKERAEYEDKYKQSLTKLRELKISRGDAKEIAKLEKDIRQNQKFSSSLGVKINRLESDATYVESDSYFNSLIRKLENQPVESNPETNETDNNAEK